MVKSIYIDTETTGTDFRKHAIIKMAGMIVYDGDVKATFDYRIKPAEGKEIANEALAVNKVTREELETYPDHAQVYGEFTRLLSRHVDKFDRRDKMFMIGYNVRFDDDFIRQFFIDHGDQYYNSFFYFPTIDVAVLAGIALRHVRPHMKNFKLMTVADALGIKISEEAAHDALYDIEITRQVMKKCMKMVA